MMRLRRASTMVVLSSLAWAATASAECAWVMWEQWYGPSSGVPLSFARTGTSGEAACRSELRKAIAGIEAQSPNPGEERRVDGDAVFFVARKDGSRVVTGIRNFLCLPDTVDPRGPKGK
jgi:hypothetical protein